MENDAFLCSDNVNAPSLPPPQLTPHDTRFKIIKTANYRQRGQSHTRKEKKKKLQQYIIIIIIIPIYYYSYYY
jgi:hypothetical protein